MSQALETAILDLLEAGPSSVKPLFVAHPRASVYEALRRLRGRGVVVPGGGAGVWQRASGGEAAQQQRLTSTPNWPTLPISHLDFMPSDVHRAVAILVVLSHMARPSYERHHASYVLYSHLGLRGKTWLMTAVAYMLGADPAVAIVHAGAETRGSLGVRRRASGEVAQVRAALATPLLGIDERGRAGDRGVQAVIDLLIHGSRTIPLEGGVLEVLAVVMLAMNCASDAFDVQQATQLDPPMQRRCHIARLDDVVLDPAFAEDGEQRLIHLRELGPVTLPTPGSMDCEDEIGRLISSALPVIVDSHERLSGIDVALLRQQAVMATWWGLPPTDAVALLLWASGTLWSTIGRTCASWEEGLASALCMTLPDDVVDDAVAPHVVATDDLSLDYSARLAELDRVAGDHGARDPELLARRLELAAAVLEAGLSARDLENLPARLGALRGSDGEAARMAVLAAIDAAGLSPDEVRRMIARVPAGRKALGLSAEDIEVVARGVEEAGLDPTEVGGWCAWAIRELGRIDGEIVEARRELRAWRREVREAAEALLTINARIEKLSQILERVKDEPALARALRFADTERERETVAALLQVAAEIRR